MKSVGMRVALLEGKNTLLDKNPTVFAVRDKKAQPESHQVFEVVAA